MRRTSGRTAYVRRASLACNQMHLACNHMHLACDQMHLACNHMRIHPATTCIRQAGIPAGLAANSELRELALGLQRDMIQESRVGVGVGVGLQRDMIQESLPLTLNRTLNRTLALILPLTLVLALILTITLALTLTQHAPGEP